MIHFHCTLVIYLFQTSNHGHPSRSLNYADKLRGENKYMKKQEDNKVTMIGLIVLAAILLLGVMINRERDAQFERYALANDCEWEYQGTAYGDDRDFICK